MSFPLRVVIDLVPDGESEAAAKSRADKRAWLAERGYRVIAITTAEVEADAKAVLERLVEVIR